MNACSAPSGCSPGCAEIDAFTRLYGAHIEAEEQLAYPAAAALLDDGARDAMGAEKRRRRGAAS